MSNNYSQMVSQIVEQIGGKDNISNVFHCMTRLRFNLVNKEVPDREAIKKIDGVLGIQDDNSGLQVIIGPHVDKVYQELIAQTGFAETEMINENLDKKSLSIKGIFDSVINAFSASMNPLVPIFVLIGTFNVVATKAPGFGDNSKNQLGDIAVMTGAKFFAKDLNMNLADMKISDLGTAKKVVVGKDKTTIIGGKGKKADVEARVEEIRSAIENTKSDYDKKKLQERLGKMTNGVALIKVGATTETELKDKKLRIEDALNATKAAVAEGVVTGGGLALVQAYTDVKDSLKSDVTDVQKGMNVVLDALKEPIMQIAENAGYDGNEIYEKQLEQKTNIGFNAKTGEWVDMFKSGLIDPTKVTRSALLNAASISGLFITTEAAVAQIPEKQPAPAQQMPEY